MNSKITIQIDWSELDLFGHVNNVMFFKYIQASRLRYCEKLGLTSLNESRRLSFMVASSRCDFRKALYYPGNVEVHTRASISGNTSFHLLHTIQNDAREIVAEGEDVLVLYDYSGSKKVPVTAELRAKMGL